MVFRSNTLPDTLDLAARLAVVVLFCALFYHLTAPVSDSDFWWHLASGRWMVEHRALLQQDPFSVALPSDEPSLFREVILKQYWLSQVLFYAVYALAGMSGIVLLSAGVYTAMFGVLYRLLRDSEVHRFLAAAFVYLAAGIVIGEFNYAVVRPQMWSSLFTVLVLYLLEMMKRGRTGSFFALPALMVVWANMHGGYVVGDIIIVLAVVGARLRREADKRFYLATGIAVLASGVNPLGYKVLVVTAPFAGPLMKSLHLSTQQHMTNLLDRIVEMQSIFTHATIGGILSRLPLYSLLLGASVLSFILNARNLRTIGPDHALLFLVVLVMGLRSIRFIVFFVAVASFVTAMNVKALVDRAVRQPSRWTGPLARSAALILILGMAADHAIAGLRTSALTHGDAAQGPHDRAIEFLRQNRVQGSVFNEYSAGGRMIWELSPDMKVFIDGRALSENAFNLYNLVVDHPVEYSTATGAPVYKALLDEQRMDVVLMPGCDAASGALIKLALALTWDREWALVYADGNSLIFMRDTPGNSAFLAKFRREKSLVYRHILGLATAAGRSEHGRLMPNWKLSMAVALDGLGNVREARRWLDEYVQAVPGDAFAREMRSRIGAS